MNVAYIRATKSGPAEAEQRAAAVAAGTDPNDPDAWYVEEPARRRRPATFEQRDLVIRALRPGDRLVIHSAPRLGATEAEIRAAAAAVSAMGAVIYDCAARAEIRHHPDAGLLLAWAAEGAALAAKERLGKAREGITVRRGADKALTGAKLKRAAELWGDLSVPVSAIARELKISARTLYRHLPKRRP